jgi:ABC-2 type transport system ATP-binding protein
MIELKNVSYGYESCLPVFRNLDLTVPPGVNLLLGPNGAGKSTLLKLVAGVEKPDSGTITVDGFDLWQDEVEARQRLCYLPEHPDLTPYASIQEIIRLVCRLRREPLGVGEQVIRQLGLYDAAGRTVRELSLGQRRRVLLAAAMLGSPSNLLMDEPLEAMDRDTRDLIVDRLAGQATADGNTILVATHELLPFAGMAAAVLAAGRGTVRVISPLPDDPARRNAILEECARGTAVW